jgi:hypothetical protein
MRRLQYLARSVNSDEWHHLTDEDIAALRGLKIGWRWPVVKVGSGIPKEARETEPPVLASAEPKGLPFPRVPRVRDDFWVLPPHHGCGWSGAAANFDRVRAIL